MSMTQRIRRSPATVAQSLRGECLVLDLGTGFYFTLGEIGGFIWEQLGDQPDLAAIVQQITSRFAIDAATAETDLLEFVEQLLDQQLLELE